MLDITLPELDERALSFAAEAGVRGPGDGASELVAALDGRISFGGPVSIGIVDASAVDDDRELAMFVEQEAGRFTYHLVHMSLTCKPEPATPRLQRVQVLLTLSSDDGLEPPIAWSMNPRRITDDAQTTSSVSLGPQLSLLGVEASLGSVERSTTRQRGEVRVEASNELQSDPAWELRRTSTMELHGTQLLTLVVRSTAGSATTIGGEVRGEVRGRSLIRRGVSQLAPPLVVSTRL